MDLFEKQELKENDPCRFEIGGAYEILGDLTDKDKCQFYEKARSALIRQVPLIRGDSYTAYGQATPLEPVRAEIKKHLNSSNEKFAPAGSDAEEGH